MTRETDLGGRGLWMSSEGVEYPRTGVYSGGVVPVVTGARYFFVDGR